MSQFQVPQFIETESKIVGPMTLKQFLYIAAAGLLVFALFFALKTFAWIIATALIATIALSLAFIKYNGRPLPVILKSALLYAWKPKLYLWKKEEVTGIPQIPEIKVGAPKETPVSKIKNIWLKIQTATGGSLKIQQPAKAPILHSFHKEHEKGTGAELLQTIREEKK